MDPFTPHSTSDDWMAMDDSANNDLDEELRALINFGMPEAARDHNASNELDEELRSLINYNFDSPRAAHQHNAMLSGRQTFGSDATMQMDNENLQWASPGYNAIARRVDDNNSYQRAQSDPNAGDIELQRQLNELKQMVSTLVRDKWQSNERHRLNEAARLFEASSFRQAGNNRSRLGSIGNQTSSQKAGSDPNVSDVDIASQIDELRRVVSALSGEQDASDVWPRPNTAHQSLRAPSSNQANKDRSRLTSKVSMPIDEPFSALNNLDDSPSLSRNPSVASTGSASSKRGRKIPGGYPCSNCDAKFDLPSQLRQHERNHMSYEDRPYPCLRCGQRFIFPKDLTRHERRAHNMHTAGEGEHVYMGSENPSQEDQAAASFEQCHGQSLADKAQTSKERTGRRRQHLDNPAAVRVRQRWSSSVLHFPVSSEQGKLSSPQIHTRASSPGSRRDSGVPSDYTNEGPSDLLLPDPNVDLAEAVRSLQLQVSARHKTINDLQRELIESKKFEEKMRSERDALAAIYYERNTAPKQRQTAYLLEQQVQQPVESSRSQGVRDDVDFDEFIIYTANSPRELDQATGHRNA